MMQTWQDLALKHKDNSKLRIGDVDCTINVELCMNQNINGYPTLVLFKNGDRIDEYAGHREIDLFEEFLNKYLHHEDL